MRSQPDSPFKPGTRLYVVSQTLDAHTPGVTVVHDDPVALASSLRHESGDGEIWLFGGVKLFAALLAGKQVDAVEITIAPVLLGGGVPLLAHMDDRSFLKLVHTRAYPSGLVALHYEVSG
jgi:dihydrofolate reductase